jgi:hypothetical protein
LNDYILKVEDFFKSFSFDDLKKDKEIYLEKFIIEEYEKINKKKEMKILILLLIINIIKYVLRIIIKFQNL